MTGDPDVRITDANGTGLEGAEILVHGLAPADITYQADATATFADGITLWNGFGPDVIDIDATHLRDGVRTTTTLNTGLGDDQVTVDLDAGEDGFFVLNTQGPYDAYVAYTDADTVRAAESSLPLIIFGGQEGDDIAAGQANDIVFGDRGLVEYVGAAGSIVAVAGNGGPGDSTDGVVRDPYHLYSVDPANGGGGNDRIAGNDGPDILIGGTADDGITGGAGNDLVFGDYGDVQAEEGEEIRASDLPLAMLEDPFLFRSIFTQTADLGGDDVIFGESDDDILLGQQGADHLYGGTGEDDIIGGHNVAAGHDGGDRIDGGAGDDAIAGDNASLLRRDDAVSPRMQVLTGERIYGDGLNGAADGMALVDGTSRANPNGTTTRTIVIFDHSDTPLPGTSGDDYIAGGADDDVIFGQLGDDVIAGDGVMADEVINQNGFIVPNAVSPPDFGASRTTTWDPQAPLVVSPSTEEVTDGDDYIEGNGGDDVIFGNLGQDDIVGGSSSLFEGLAGDESQRPDGTDILFGGAGMDLARNNYGDTDVDGHARDADVIAGDNANIYRLVGTNGVAGGFLSYAYDDYGALKVIPRAVALEDYTEGGPDYDVAALGDNGAADEIHGESGDDQIYGMAGNDVLYGEGQDDDLIGGWGHDWASGGTGTDGILGDDGRIYTSRNTEGDPTLFAEPLYGQPFVEVDRGSDTLVIRTPGNLQRAEINQIDELRKTVNLTPFNVDPQSTGVADPQFAAQYADDILFGGLGDDFLHGGSGDDLVVGAEALGEAYFEAFGDYTAPDSDREGTVTRSDYERPYNPGNALGFEARKAGEFAAYDEYNPLRKIFLDLAGNPVEYFANFDAADPGAPEAADPLIDPDTGEETTAFTDGNDRVFGDLGNDWAVGGTGQDYLFGGYGNDLLNADDDHTSASQTEGDPIANDTPDTSVSYEDIAYGGAGRDVLIANTGGDRIIDWAGEFNSYLVPFAPFGAFTISRSLQPQLKEYLYDLSEAAGADRTRDVDEGRDSADLRNGEPDGEIGLVEQQDFDWQDQTGAPDDVQPGNIPGGARDVLRGANFNTNGNNDTNGTVNGFAADTGSWTVENGRLSIAPEALGGDAASVFYVDNYLPTYFEIQAVINAAKPIAGYKSNTYIIFDYQGPTDFKFAGINISTDKIQMGRRTEAGWIVDVQTPAKLKPDRDYNVLVAINGLTVTLVVDNQDVFTHTFEARIDAYGVSHGLNDGMVGLGSENAIARVDNLQVQVLPPEITLLETETFEDGTTEHFAPDPVGSWQFVDARYDGSPLAGSDGASAAIDLVIRPAYLLRLQSTFQTSSAAGFFFDRYSGDEFKFVILSAETDQVVIGHHTGRGGWAVDAVQSFTLEASRDYELEITLKGSTVSVMIEGQVVLGYAFNSLVVDGEYGLYVENGLGSFDSVSIMSDDPFYLGYSTNSAPEAADNALGTEKGTPLIIDGAFLLANDLDADGDPLSIDSFAQPGNGGLVDNGDGTYTYTPDAGFVGEDSFIYTVTDGRGGYSSAIVHITVVTSGQSSPTALMAAMAAPGDSSLSVTAGEVAETAARLLARWQAQGVISENQLAQLEQIDLVVADLPGQLLGLAGVGVIYIDTNAAGFGWYVGDSVPSPGLMDLLSVLAHELGHELGLGHDDHGVMTAMLMPGERLLSAGASSDTRGLVVENPAAERSLEDGAPVAIPVASGTDVSRYPPYTWATVTVDGTAPSMVLRVSDGGELPRFSSLSPTGNGTTRAALSDASSGRVISAAVADAMTSPIRVEGGWTIAVLNAPGDQLGDRGGQGIGDAIDPVSASSRAPHGSAVGIPQTPTSERTAAVDGLSVLPGVRFRPAPLPRSVRDRWRWPHRPGGSSDRPRKQPVQTRGRPRPATCGPPG
ncbi:MAG: cadherin-like domain-containing protein, partial [Acidobacteriota bacterium]